MDITYLGHSSFKIAGKAATLVTDPFDPSMTGLKLSKVEADIVTVSHDHPDHNNVSAVEAVHKVVNGPGEYEIKGVSILGYSSFHDNEKGEKRGKNTMYVIEIDGLRVAHLGDLGHSLTESQAGNLGNIDVLMIPVGGEYTIGPKEAVEVVKTLEPSVIIPMHYQTPGLNSEAFSLLKPVTDFVTLLGTTPETVNKLSIKEGTLTEEQKVYILERK